jgi:hypothetical protein
MLTAQGFEPLELEIHHSGVDRSSNPLLKALSHCGIDIENKTTGITPVAIHFHDRKHIDCGQRETECMAQDPEAQRLCKKFHKERSGVFG